MSNNTQQAGETAKELYEIVPRDEVRLPIPEDWLCAYHPKEYIYLRPISTSAPDAVKAVKTMETKIEEFAEMMFNAGREFMGAGTYFMYDDYEDWKNRGGYFVNGKFDMPLKFPAGHAEGQKATVEAKSARVWVKASDRVPSKYKWPEHDKIHYRVDGIRADGNLIEVDGEIQFDYVTSDGNNRVYELSRVEWLDETPTSHAEGEKGAVGFAEWIAQNDWSFSPVSQMWHNSGSAKLTFELYNTYLKALTC